MRQLLKTIMLSRGFPFLVAVLLATVLSGVSSLQHRESYLHLGVQSDVPSVLTLYVDDGHGFTEQHAQQVRLKGAKGYRSVRFALPGGFFRSLRLDYSPQVKQLRVNSLYLADKRTFPFRILKLKVLQALHGVDIHAYGGEAIEISTTGSDPQMQIVVAWWQLLLWQVSFGSWLALSLLCYPFLIMLCRSCARLAEGGSSSTWWHTVQGDPVFFAGLLCWLLAAVYVLQPALHEKVTSSTKNGLVRYEKELQPQEIQLERIDGLQIAARMYLPDESAQQRGALLLLHGNYPRGQAFPLYPLLATALSEQGYVVLTIDFAGYGRSQDPFAQPEPRRVDLQAETGLALTYLAEKVPEYAGRIGIIGHSMGADPALLVGLRNPRVGTIMLLGPPRRVWDRFHWPADRDFFWNWAIGIGKKQYQRLGFPHWFDQDRWVEEIVQRDMTRVLPVLESWQHPPVLLIDGEREPRADLAFLAAYARKMSYPKGYVTLANTDHNCNIQEMGHRIFYDPAALEQVVGVLDRWYQQTTAASQTGFSDLWLNLLQWLFADCPVIGGR